MKSILIVAVLRTVRDMASVNQGNDGDRLNKALLNICMEFVTDPRIESIGLLRSFISQLFVDSLILLVVCSVRK